MQGISNRQRQHPSDEDAQLSADTTRYCDNDGVEHTEGLNAHDRQADEALPVPVQSQSLAESLHPDLMSAEHTQEEGPSVDHASQQYPLGQAFEAYERRYRHLGDIEFDNSARRMEFYYRLDNFRQHFDRLQHSVELLLEPPPNTNDSNPSPKKPRGRRKKLQSNVKLDLKALEKQLHSLNDVSEELRDYDRKQEGAERLLDNAVQTIATTLRRSKLIPENETALEVSLAPTIASMSEHPSNASPPIAAELEAYYAAVSTLRNMNERIGDLQAEQQEQWERRGVMEDQGQVLDQSEDEFLRTWNDTLAVAYKDFTAAQADVKRTREDCEAKAIAIPTWAEVDSVGEDANQSIDDVAEDISQPLPDIAQPRSQKGLSKLFNEPPLYDTGSPLATPTYVPMAKDKVARWIKDTDPILEPQPQEFSQGTPVALPEDVTLVAEQQHTTLPPPDHFWSDVIPVSAQSDTAPATTSSYTAAFGEVTAVHRASSLGAEQGLEVDDDLRIVAPIESTQSL